jgi:group I intron endonuclease
VTTFSFDSIQNCTSSCGIYAIRGKYNNFHLVGQTTRSFYLRWKEHLRKAERGDHDNPYFQNSFTKNGKENFEFILLEECSSDILNDRETYWIKTLNSLKTENGWNLRDGGAFGIYGDELRKRVSDGIQKSEKSRLEKISRRKEYTLISPTGDRVTFIGLRLFCDTHNLHSGTILKLLKGKAGHVKGWKLPSEEFQKIRQNIVSNSEESLPKFYRTCPECKRIIKYSRLSTKNYAERDNKKCKSCASMFH